MKLKKWLYYADNWNDMQKLAILDGIFYAIMAGFGDRYIVPFALKLGANDMQISLLNSLLYIISGITSIFGVEIVRILNSRKRFISDVSIMQSFLWFILAMIPFYFSSPNFVIILYVLNFAVHSLLVPVWISLMGDAVKGKTGHYFGIRTSIIQLFQLISTYVAARILERFGLIGFAIAFIIAGIARFASALIQRHYPDLPYNEDKSYTFKEFLKHISTDNFGLFVIFQFFFYFSVFIASPFFVPFLLNDLKLSYVQYAIIINITPIMTILFSPLFGKLGDLYGERNVFAIASFLIPFVPIFWALSNGFWSIFLVELFSGFVWSAFNLATSNFLYSSLDSAHRARGVAYLMLIRGIGIALGSTLGGIILTYHPIHAVNTTRILFLISGLMRFITAYFFVLKIKEVRKDVTKIAILDYIHSRIHRVYVFEDNIKKKLSFYFQHHQWHHSVK